MMTTQTAVGVLCCRSVSRPVARIVIVQPAQIAQRKRPRRVMTPPLMALVGTIKHADGKRPTPVRVGLRFLIDMSQRATV